MFTRLRIMLVIPIVLVFMAISQAMSANLEKMPDNFGKMDWVLNNWNDAVEYLKYVSDNKTRQRLKSGPGKPSRGSMGKASGPMKIPCRQPRRTSSAVIISSG